MSTYNYVCEKCNYRCSKERPIGTPHPKKCPKCKTKYSDDGEGYHQDYSTLNVISVIMGQPTTIGQQMEMNEKKRGRELSEITLRESEKNKKKVGKGRKVDTKKEGETPWWRNGVIDDLPKMDKPLDLSKIKDTKKYIETGLKE